jgi:class 3 adenylate cyclase
VRFFISALPSNLLTLDLPFHVKTFSDHIITNTPILVTFAVAIVFLSSIGLFLLYSHLVDKRQQLVLNKAAQSTAIVSSMFPKEVRDRILEDTPDKTSRKSGTTNQLQCFLNGHDGSGNSRQIADLYTQCTVMFADIVGFTAWSPEHVFMLLQTIYHGFDQVAKRRKVFKVETIGDCYLAVTGLPKPQPAHAVIMARFAWECKNKLIEMTRDLEVSLGPDCGELRMRFGMHSGPVTAGVLRGDRARFQLFGDTVNTGMFV